MAASQIGPPRASCTAILLARPVRMLILAVLVCITIASLSWTPPPHVQEKVTHYLDKSGVSAGAAHGREKMYEYLDKSGIVAGAAHGREKISEYLDKSPLVAGAANMPGKISDYLDKSGLAAGASRFLEHPAQTLADGYAERYGGGKKQKTMTSDPSPYAYVFYATDDIHACSILVNVDRLQQKFGTTYPIYVLVNPMVSQSYLDAFSKRNVAYSVEEVPLQQKEVTDASRHGYLRLMTLKMHRVNHNLKRVIVMDWDQMIMQSLDHVFDEVPGVDIAAPKAYWSNKDLASSSFMVVSLSDRLWELMEVQLNNVDNAKFDMGVVNEAIGHSTLLLPGTYTTLDSHWETWTVPEWLHHQDDALNDTATFNVPSLDALFKKESKRTSAESPSTQMRRLFKRKRITKRQDEDQTVSFSKLQGAHAPAKAASEKAPKPKAKVDAAPQAYVPGDEKKGTKARPMNPVKEEKKPAAKVVTPTKALKPEEIEEEEEAESPLPMRVHPNDVGKVKPPGTKKKTKGPAPLPKAVHPNDVGKSAEQKAKEAAAAEKNAQGSKVRGKPETNVEKPKAKVEDKPQAVAEAKLEEEVEEKPKAKPKTVTKPKAKAGSISEAQLVDVEDEKTTSPDAASPLKGKITGSSAKSSKVKPIVSSEDKDLDEPSSSVHKKPAHSDIKEESTPKKDSSTSSSKSLHSASDKDHDSTDAAWKESKHAPVSMADEDTKAHGPKTQRPNYAELEALYKAAAVFNFASGSKPWQMSYEEVQEKKMDAHPLFYEMFREWRTGAVKACPAGLVDSV